jgi:hypothetical protein
MVCFRIENPEQLGESVEVLMQGDRIRRKTNGYYG